MPQDYAALAAQFGGKPAQQPAAPQAVDYAALAAQHGGVPAKASAPAPAEAAPDEPQRSMVDKVGDVLEGAANTAEDFVLGGMGRVGLGGTLYNIARLASAPLPGPTLPPRADVPALQPRNTAERAGQLVEQTGEFFAPGGLVKEGAAKIATAAPKLATAGRAALEGLSAAGVAAAQGSNPVAAGALAAAGPIIGAGVEGLVPGLRDAAEKKVVQALGPTKERYKAMAERLAPQILRRGLSGSRESLLAKAADTVEATGDQLDTVLQAYGSQPMSTGPIVSTLEAAKDAFRTTNAKGAIVEFEPRAIKQLSGLQDIIKGLGPDASVDQLVAIRRAWDKVVDQAGGFAHRGGGAIGVPLADTTEAWAKREATGAIRKELAQAFPDMAAVNKEFSFWKGLQDVLTQTVQRTQPQGPGLMRQVAGAAGAAAGASGGIPTALLTGKLGQMAHAVFTSPRFRLIDAGMRNALADALASGQSSRVAGQLSRIAASIGAQLPMDPAASH
jgi:hypothetical protein